MKLMSEANFIGVFVGIESPDADTLVAMRKKQNTRRNIAQSIHRIYAAGLYVTAGFIIGFDSEQRSVADALIELIEEAAIPICMVGLLFALPNTQLTRRLAREGRLHAELLSAPEAAIDQATQGLNFDTVRPREEILSDFKRVLENVYDPAAYAKRLQRLAGLLGRSNRNRRASADDSRSRIDALGIVHRILSNLPQGQTVFKQTIIRCASTNPQWARTIVMLTAFYLHLGPFSRQVIRRIEQQLEELRTAAPGPRGPISRPALPERLGDVLTVTTSTGGNA